MLCTKHPLSRLHHLHLQLFSLFLSALIPVRQRQVSLASLHGRMLYVKHPLSRLHHLHIQLFSFLLSTLKVVYNPTITVLINISSCSWLSNFLLVFINLTDSFSASVPFPFRHPYHAALYNTEA